MVKSIVASKCSKHLKHRPYYYRNIHHRGYHKQVDGVKMLLTSSKNEKTNVKYNKDIYKEKGERRMEERRWCLPLITAAGTGPPLILAMLSD
jgi:hypothetical protein